MLYVKYIMNKELTNTIELQEGNSKQKPIYYLDASLDVSYARTYLYLIASL